jgi:FkbM family methyltransferase
MMALASTEIIELDIPGLAPGLKMQLHPSGDQIISAKLRKEKCWEPYETYLTLKHLQSGDVYVDIGANIGYYTLLAAQKVGDQGKVIAYEPDTDNFSLLQHNIALNGFKHTQIFQLALYDKNTEGELFLSDDNFGDHRIFAAHENRDSRTITLVKGDEHVSRQSTRIDFLKIDTQGSEFFVVNGLMQLITNNRKHLRMILEFCPHGIRHSGADGHELVRLLADTLMQIHIIDHQQQCLIPAQAHHLDEWINQMADEPLNEGFVNLLLTPSGYAAD